MCPWTAYLPMGEVVGTHKLMLKHTYVTDGLVKEVNRVKDGDVMILVGMPPHHREEEMVTKMEKEFDVGILVLTPEMAKRKVQGSGLVTDGEVQDARGSLQSMGYER